VFNLNEDNYTVIYVQNERGDDSNYVQVRYFDSEGNLLSGESRPLSANEMAEFVVPAGFVGPANVDCNNWCTSMATWKIALPGQASYKIGLPGNNTIMCTSDQTLRSVRYASWAGPIPPMGFDSKLGLAIKAFGPTYPDASCSIKYFSQGGELAATELLTIPPGASTAFLSANIPDGIPPSMIGPDGFSGSLIMECSVDVVPLVIVQDQITGFPALIHLEPYYLDAVEP